MKNPEEVRKQFQLHLILQRFADKTKEAYLGSVDSIGKFHKQPPENLTNNKIQDYLIYCIQDKKLAWSSCNVVFCGLKCFYKEFLKRDDSEFSIPPRPRSRQLPNFLSVEEVEKLLQATTNIKHKALLAMVYGSGLRASEAVRLQSRHVESNRMMLRVEQGKGRKDRYTVLSQTALEWLRDYWRAYQPGEWLFFGQDKAKPMSIGTAQKIFYQAKERIGISRVNGIHCLRHSFATHMNEQGCQIFVLKRFLGHSSIKTTYRYVHLSPDYLEKIVSPLDLLLGKKS